MLVGLSISAAAPRHSGKMLDFDAGERDDSRDEYFDGRFHHADAEMSLSARHDSTTRLIISRYGRH